MGVVGRAQLESRVPLLRARGRETKKSKGIAYLQYGAAEEAVRAYRQLDGAIFQVGWASRNPLP